MEIRRMSDEYRDLRALWVAVFGDKADEVDDFYAAWGDDIEGYVLEDERVIRSALTMFRMGDFVIPSDCIVTSKVGVPAEEVKRAAYISYAICTDEAARGLGYGSRITEFARDVALARGAVSILCPAESSLIRFYMPLSYEPRFYATERKLNASAGELSFSSLDASEYGDLREEMLSGIAHIELSEPALSFIASWHKLYCIEGLGDGSGKIILAHENDSSRFTEVLASEGLEQSAIEDVLAVLAGKLGIEELTYRMPGNDYLQTGTRDAEYVQAMLASDGGFNFSNGYFGFSFD